MDLKDKKQEKLASAIYLITTFLSDQEPLKWKLRALASDLISGAMSLKGKQSVSLEMRDIVLKITGLLSVARNAGLVSDENHDIMQEEFMKYVGTFEHLGSVPDLLGTESSHLQIDREMMEGSTIRDKIERQFLTSGSTSGRVPKASEHLKVFGAVSVRKNGRQNIIISTLKRRKEVMIKDISSLIDGCSEKTIQRELSAMVQSGLLKKVGEKRWSRYSLA